MSDTCYDDSFDMDIITYPRIVLPDTEEKDDVPEEEYYVFLLRGDIYGISKLKDIMLPFLDYVNGLIESHATVHVYMITTPSQTEYTSRILGSFSGSGRSVGTPLCGIVTKRDGTKTHRVSNGKGTYVGHIPILCTHFNKSVKMERVQSCFDIFPRGNLLSDIVANKVKSMYKLNGGAFYYLSPDKINLYGWGDATLRH